MSGQGFARGLARSVVMAGSGHRCIEIGGEVEIDLGNRGPGNLVGLGVGRRGLGGNRSFCHEVGSRRLVLKREFAEQLLFEVEAEIVFLGGLLDGSRLRRGRLILLRRCLGRLARVETHDPGQFRKRIVVRKVDLIGDF